ncbi:exported hypothetical protein [Frankia sp. Hr75.2]|nr:exported hypothetical protein [Frankia sp. Hr75.2]
MRSPSRRSPASPPRWPRSCRSARPGWPRCWASTSTAGSAGPSRPVVASRGPAACSPSWTSARWTRPRWTPTPDLGGRRAGGAAERVGPAWETVAQWRAHRARRPSWARHPPRPGRRRGTYRYSPTLPSLIVTIRDLIVRIGGARIGGPPRRAAGASCGAMPPS